MKNLECYNQLIKNLEEVIKVYRSLLSVVRKEKEILISAELDDLTANNLIKEKVILKAKSLEKFRQTIVDDLLLKEKIEIQNPSLLDLAKYYQGVPGDKLRNSHAVLELLIRRVKEINLSNENLIRSALDNITGAMKSIKGMLNDNKTYQNKGIIKEETNNSGQLVSKQV